MAIWTSRYNNKELANDKYYPVGISIGKPRFRLGYNLKGQCTPLAPKGNMLKMDAGSFRQAYYEKLEETGAGEIISIVTALEERAKKEGKELVLLCFEDIRIDGDWCHRAIFAEWWEERTGQRIKELPDPTPPKGKKASNPAWGDIKEDNYKQMSMFDRADE